MTRRPKPLTPADCNLQAFRNMPLDAQRFRDSDLVTEEDPETVIAALHLWLASWHQVPAASLPNDERALAKFAGYGRSLKAWDAVRDGALRGFVECSDGRLYHRVVAEKANEAWDKRLNYEWGKAKDRHRKAEKDLPAEQKSNFPDFDDWKAGRPAPDREDELPLEPPGRSAGKSAPVRARAPIARADRVRAPAHTEEEVEREKTAKRGSNSGGNGEEFQRNEGEIPAENALKGIEGKGRESIELSHPLPEPLSVGLAGDGPGMAPDLVDLHEAVCRAAGYKPVSPVAIAASMDQVKEWRDEGHDFDTIVLPAIRNVVANSKPDDRTRTLGRFRHAIAREAAKAGQAQASGRKHVPDEPILEPEGEDALFRPMRKALLDRVGAATYSLRFNALRFSGRPCEFGEERCPLEVHGPEYLVDPVVHGDHASVLRNAAKAIGFSEVWKGR